MSDCEYVIKKLCCKCNKEFILKSVEHNGCIRESVSNFEECPHCGERNDTWISVKWPGLMDERIKELESALQRIRPVPEKLIAGKPVRNLDEILSECDKALQIS